MDVFTCNDIDVDVDNIDMGQKFIVRMPNNTKVYCELDYSGKTYWLYASRHVSKMQLLAPLDKELGHHSVPVHRVKRKSKKQELLALTLIPEAIDILVNKFPEL